MPQTQKARTRPSAIAAAWRHERPYLWEGEGRDERIDFMRGVAMAVLVVNHLSFFSLYNYLTWERVGIVSAAGPFVSLSGIVVGIAYSRRVTGGAWGDVVGRLWKRAGVLYRANLAVIAIVLFAAAETILDTQALSAFTDPVSGTTYPLFPAAEAPWWLKLGQALRLQYGPHQFQIIGLYVVLVFATPALLWLMQTRKTGLLLWLSWVLYFTNWLAPANVTGAQFENAFPLLAWQLPYVHGLAVGFHRSRVESVMASRWRRPILLVLAAGFLTFLFVAQNSPRLPEQMRLSLLPAATLEPLYATYFEKTPFGLLRAANLVCVLAMGYWLLTWYWGPLNRALGWFFVPLGQASLYVFIVHVLVVLLWSNLPFLWTDNVWANTLSHTVALGLLWALVRHRVFFSVIPR